MNNVFILMEKRSKYVVGGNENEGKSQHTCHKMEKTVRKEQKNTSKPAYTSSIDARELLYLQILQTKDF